LKNFLTIHLVYPHKPKARTPDSIGFNLAKELRAHGYDVRLYSLYDELLVPFIPTRNDILIGHPRWENNNTFRQLLKKKGWGRIIVLHPFCPRDLWSYAHLYFYCIFADSFIAITGKYWKNEIINTHFSEWHNKILQLDLAIDTNFFPKVKKNFNPAGKRKFLFVGNHPHYKNVDFLNKLAGNLKQIEFHRIGPTSRKYKNLIQHGKYELSSPEAKQIVKNMDFMITMSNRDANPTTIIEASSMGLVAICPIGSGYLESDGVFNISGSDMKLALEQINNFNCMEEVVLDQKRKQMDGLIKTRYTWSIFSMNVIKEIERNENHTYKIKSFFDLSIIYIVFYFLARKSPWRIFIKKYLKICKSYILDVFKK
jgi:glycosyltransferase involved in cell wall biosynthesis